jgi:rare lipoprotein A
MMSSPRFRRRTPQRRVSFMAGGLCLVLLAGCEGGGPAFLQGAKSNNATATRSTKLVERDVEAPEVFSVTDQGLWDGRPSLGGVWVAHPDVTDPERVIIRNQSNDKFVIGALFRRERDLPGPKLQISSDAAAALGILAGAPAPLNVTALRREEEEEAPLAETAAETAAPELPASGEDTGMPAMVIPAEPDISTATLPAATAAPAAPAPTPVAAAKPAAGAPARPFVQLGIFSVEENATRTAKQMRGAGLTPSVKRSEINGKPFWRVLVGPATSASELDRLIAAVKAEGFTDAYATAN